MKKSNWRKWLRTQLEDSNAPPAGNNIVKNAAWTARHQEARGSRLLIWVTLLAICVLILWASFASIDEVVRGEGKVVPSRQVQVIQNLDGGVVEEIFGSSWAVCRGRRGFCCGLTRLGLLLP